MNIHNPYVSHIYNIKLIRLPRWVHVVVKLFAAASPEADPETAFGYQKMLKELSAG